MTSIRDIVSGSLVDIYRKGPIMRMLALRLSRFAARLIVCGVFVAGGSAHAQTNGQPPSYETAFYPSGKFKIEAYVYKPEGTGPFPVAIYNHGSRAG
ncbi:MAG TPA: hypothetical protein VF749_10000, partial [Candidatus Acidoferrum sp.]